MATTRVYTAEDLEAMGSAYELYELYDGVLTETEKMGGRHGEFQVEISSPLNVHVRANRLGRVYPSDTHFILARNPDRVVMPDVAFVRADRLPTEEARERFMPLAPDLAVEVVSPSDRMVDVLAKIALYQQAGVQLIWLVQPRAQAVTVYALGREPRTLREGETLDGGDVVPGFRLPVANIFA